MYDPSIGLVSHNEPKPEHGFDVQASFKWQSRPVFPGGH